MVCGLATVLPIQQVRILTFVFGPETFPGLSRNGPQEEFENLEQSPTV